MKKDVFIRIPKTGSTSLSNSLKLSNNIDFLYTHQYCYPQPSFNTGWLWSKDGIFPNWNKDNYKKIYAVVRNPFDLLLSYYYHNNPKPEYDLIKAKEIGIKIDSSKLDGWLFCNQIHNFNNWEEFLEGYLNPNFEWHLPPMKKSLFSMAYDRDWNLIIDRYFKIENPNNINNFLRYNNLPILDRLNITKSKVVKKHYTLKQVEQLNKIWEHDLKYFNYQYQGQ
jgi:hypothetical protein